MKRRREALLTLAAGLVAAAVLVQPVLADEHFGVITDVALPSQKVTVLTKRGEKLELAITGNTEIANGKGEKVSLEAVAEATSKAIKDGNKGIFARVTHENMVASKISVGLPQKKKAE